MAFLLIHFCLLYQFLDWRCDQLEIGIQKTTEHVVLVLAVGLGKFFIFIEQPK